MSAETTDSRESVIETTDESRTSVETFLREIARVTGERDHYKQLAALLKAELDRLKDLQKTPREHVDPNEVQLAFEAFAKELLEKCGAKTESEPTKDDASGDEPKEKKKEKKNTPHGRSVLPEHLPVQTLILTPSDVPDDAQIVDYEIGWRLGFRRGGFYRLKVLRPVLSVSRSCDVDVSVVSATIHEGDLSAAPSSVTVNLASAAATPPAATVEPSVVRSEPSDGATLSLEGAESPTADHGAGAADEEGSPSEATPAPSAGVVPEGAGAPVDVPLAADAEEPRASGSDSETKLVCAELPGEMIARGLPTPDLLAHVFTAKFSDKNPFNRQEGIYGRERVHISRTNMCRWAAMAHESAKRVVDAMCKEALATAPFICTDATGILVQANERCKRGHFWIFVAGQDHVFFRYSAKHTHEQPLDFFKGYKGIVVSDASNVYDALFRDPNGPEEAGCNAHARRYFYKALDSDKERALIGIGFFNELFELERTWKGLPPAKRLILRKERAAPLMEKLREWRDEQLLQADVADGTPIRRALKYARNHWEALTRFLSHGKIPIHNNWSEGGIRHLVIGRANWTFVGSDESAEWTCTFVSLVASCALHKLDPEAYFGDLFRVLPSWPQTQMIELAPKYWSATRARLKPCELALPFGPITVPATPLVRTERDAE